VDSFLTALLSESHFYTMNKQKLRMSEMRLSSQDGYGYNQHFLPVWGVSSLAVFTDPVNI
jgi:hypothetical protein